ncbi:hypothetical protein Pcinc_015523 [Petrolisthes cinctipes]|uniref:Rhodanese domain-containing protein n=1 Tax=Petrolisthes cinctipes TaxID=88211 RepID=A0AAE1FUT9_PETCI|nr:hypothetical protein Pcinc_015523 [Petrolisthes cinctipes]
MVVIIVVFHAGEVTMRWLVQISKRARYVSQAWGSQVSQAYLCDPAVPFTSHNYCTSPSFLPDVDFKELTEMLETKSITLLDVRLPLELKEMGMIPQSKNLILQPLGPYILLSDEKFLERTGFEKPRKDDPIVVTCLAGVRARTAQMALMAAGYTDVRRYKGSFEDWLEKGGPVVYPEMKE